MSSNKYSETDRSQIFVFEAAHMLVAVYQAEIFEQSLSLNNIGGGGDTLD